MATTTVTCNKDSRLAVSGASHLGAGASNFNPYGTYGGYRYRTLMGFPINFTGWTAINSAILYVRTSTQSFVAFGSDPNGLFQRINVAWSEGSSSGLSGSNSVIDPGPNATTINQVLVDMPTTEGTWVAVDITLMMRDVLAGNPFWGIRILGVDNAGTESSAAANVGEIYSREGGSAPYIAFNYETNRPPDAPVVTSADVVGGLSGTTTPTLDFLLTDPDAGATLDNYHWQIDDNSDFSSPIQDLTVSAGGPWPSGTHITVNPAALTRGTTYYVRVQSADGLVWGPYSTTFQFKVASLPTVTTDEPSATGRLARLRYDAGSSWASPRMRVDWTTTCPDGGTQQSYRVEVFNDAAGAIGASLNDSGTVVDSATGTRVVPATLTEGSYYHVRVTGTCSHGLSVVVAARRVRARWGVVTHRFDMGAATSSLALTALDVTDETTAGAGRVTVEYATTTTVAAPAAYASSIGGAGLNRYLWYRAWLLAWGASPAVSPTLNQLKVTYDVAAIVPDKWVLQDPVNAAGDVAAYVYGTKSLRMLGKGSGHSASQQIPVVPNTLYVLSGRIQSLGASQAQILFSSGPTAGALVATTAIAAGVGFEEPGSRVFTVPWFSGSNTSVYIRCYVAGAVGTTAWFDALKVEASTVVTPWSPGYIANAVVLDSGGLQIDAFSGGIFRLRGSAGGTRDTIDLAINGLRFGNDLDLWSPAAERLDTSGSFVSRGVMASGAGAGTGGYWARVATGVLASQFHGHHFLCAFGQSWGTSVTAGNSIASITVQQQPGFGTQPNVIIHVLPGGAQVASDIAVVVTSVAGPTTYEVWVRSTTSYGQPFFALLHAIESVGGSVVPVEGYALQAAIGAGTAYYGKAWNQGVSTGSGSAFPANPTNGDKFWRTDLLMEYFWNGTRWLSTTLYSTQGGVGDSSWLLTVTSASPRWVHPGSPLTEDIWVEDVALTFYVAAGTALSASHKWVGIFAKVDTANASTGLATFNVDSGALATWRRLVVAVDALIGSPATYPMFQMTWTKTGTPSGIYAPALFTYRTVGV